MKKLDEIFYFFRCSLDEKMIYSGHCFKLVILYALLIDYDFRK